MVPDSFKRQQRAQQGDEVDADEDTDFVETDAEDDDDDGNTSESSGAGLSPKPRGARGTRAGAGAGAGSGAGQGSSPGSGKPVYFCAGMIAYVGALVLTHAMMMLYRAAQVRVQHACLYTTHTMVLTHSLLPPDWRAPTLHSLRCCTLCLWCVAAPCWWQPCEGSCVMC